MLFSMQKSLGMSTEADMEKVEHRKYTIESKRRKKRKDQDLRVKILMTNMKKFIKFLQKFIS
jgi:hypothetical protein